MALSIDGVVSLLVLMRSSSSSLLSAAIILLFAVITNVNSTIIYTTFLSPLTRYRCGCIDTLYNTTSSTLRYCSSKQYNVNSEATMDEAAMKLLRQQKQTLRKYIRSNIKSTYPPSTSTTRTSSNELLTTQSNSVFKKLFTLPQYQAAKSVGFFLSMPNYEIQTKSAIQQIVYEDGKVLYVPKVGLDFEECDMDLIRCDTTTASATNAAASSNKSGSGEESGSTEESAMFYDNWPRNKWGIPEPPLPSSITTTTTNNTNINDGIAKPGDIDLLIVPGLAFDSNGHRLGQGKGYYDRFIAKMRCQEKEKKPLLVGVCLEEQFLDTIPDGLDLGSDKGEGSSSRSGIIPISEHDYLMDMVITPSKIYDHTSRR